MQQQVYLDRGQCERFGVGYFGADTLEIRADQLLASKDYDEIHRDTLDPLGTKVISLSREADENPGWYTVVASLDRGFGAGPAVGLNVYAVSVDTHGFVVIAQNIKTGLKVLRKVITRDFQGTLLCRDVGRGDFTLICETAPGTLPSATHAGGR
jgi:hypothetical protein